MKASIVVPTRGGASRLPVLFRALREQTEKDFEVIVVLDGDIDSSRQVCEHEKASGDLAVRIIEFPENRGRVAALNAGFDAAEGDVLIRSDDDFEPRATFVSRHVELHADGPCGAVGIAENIFADTPYAKAYGKASDGRFLDEVYATPEHLRWKFWAGNVSVDAATYRRVGPYDPDYRAYGWEDVDWGYRLHAAGIPIVIDPHLATPHHLASVTTQIRARRAYQSASARHLFEKKHPEAMAEYHLPWSPWNIAVRAVAVLPPNQSLKMAAGVDKVLPKLPSAIGGKAVALIVEGCALGGRWRPGRNDMSI